MLSDSLYRYLEDVALIIQKLEGVYVEEPSILKIIEEANLIAQKINHKEGT